MTTDEIRALEPNARRRLEEFRDCFKKAPVFDYLVSYSLGLLATLERKSIEPIALWIGVAVRTLQLFLSQFAWDHARIESRLRRMIVDQYGSDNSIGVIDASAHAKQGDTVYASKKGPASSDNGVASPAKSTIAWSASI